MSACSVKHLPLPVADGSLTQPAHPQWRSATPSASSAQEMPILQSRAAMILSSQRRRHLVMNHLRRVDRLGSTYSSNSL
eukprot:21574-Heterococcus_DN1.PRE.1